MFADNAADTSGRDKPLCELLVEATSSSSLVAWIDLPEELNIVGEVSRRNGAVGNDSGRVVNGGGG